MTPATTVRIALPSKGRMESETMDFFARCDLRINKTNPRQYSALIPALPQVQVLFQRARDIPKSVAAGDVDLGITGYDLLANALGDHREAIVVVHEALGYGQCELVAAVPGGWDEVSTLADLAARSEAAGGLRVATKHHNLVERFFAENGVPGIQIVAADGALEAAPVVGYADFIADVTSTGTTLLENNLKPLEDGLIVRSEASLIGNRAGLAARDDLLDTTVHLLEFIEAHLRASGQYMVFANMRGESAEAIADLIYRQTELGGLQGPTISKILSRDPANGWWAVNLVVRNQHLFSAVSQLREIGGSGVVVTPVTYIFDERPPRVQRLLETLGKREEAALP